MRPDFLDSATVLNTVEGLSSEIYADLVHSEDVAVCAWLQERFSVSTDLQTDFLFKTVFRSFYGLDRAKLSAEFVNAYFRLFEKERRNKCPDVQRIVGALYKYGTGTAGTAVHFSFATKMAATIRPEWPVYDGNIATLFHFNPYKNLNIPKKLVPKARFDRYMALLQAIQETLRQSRGRQMIREFGLKLRNDVNGWSNLDPMKQGDLILWSAGRRLISNERRISR